MCDNQPGDRETRDRDPFALVVPKRHSFAVQPI
jgi:hypothetical protein